MTDARRTADLSELMRTLVALRTDLCKDGVPAHLVEELGAEEIKTLCHLATVAIDTTKRLIDEETQSAPHVNALGSVLGPHGAVPSVPRATNPEPSAPR